MALSDSSGFLIDGDPMEAAEQHAGSSQYERGCHGAKRDGQSEPLAQITNRGRPEGAGEKSCGIEPGKAGVATAIRGGMGDQRLQNWMRPKRRHAEY